MKKGLNIKLYSIIFLLSFTNCASDENNTSNSLAELLVGTWKANKKVYVCASGSTKISEYNSCVSQGGYIFTLNENSKEGGTFNISQYFLDGDTCVKDSDYDGTWSIDGDKLIFKINDQTIIPAIFEVTQSILRVGQYDSSPNDFCLGEDKPSYEYVELIKIN